MADNIVYILAHDEAVRRAEMSVKDPANRGRMVVIRDKVRTLEQNAHVHALFTDLEKSGLRWMGRPRKAAEWKVLMISGHSVVTGEGAEVITGVEGEMVNIRESSADMSVARGSSLIDYVLAFCAMNGVDPETYKKKYGGLQK